jgi:molybdopterin-containing oxidoreductase family iron-sulfur binding subunit
MVIDTNACIGCNACVVACQAENNVPVVGPEEISQGRDMHWLRVDSYAIEQDGKDRRGFQTVPCMHCELAPCEPVCPVEASVHDHEGLNVQVYNRCIGTRFCEANCPYKVRRFNWYDYSGEQAYQGEGDAMKAQHNPDVSVRGRGVMEKCNYCLQRIVTGRIAADRESRRLRDGEIVTACQAACPTRAIVFGDLNDPLSEASARRASPHNYALLAELNTRPRTTYLARITNPSTALLLVDDST